MYLLRLMLLTVGHHGQKGQQGLCGCPISALKHLLHVLLQGL
jgi:hypothetical protein